MESEVEVNPLLATACYRVLNRFGKDGELSGAVFNKIVTLLNRRLLEDRVEQRIDMNLPHCWYLFGDEVVPRELPRIVQFEPADAPVQRATFKLNLSLEPPEAVPDWQASRLAFEMRRIEEEFGKPVDLPALVTEVYEGAPFPFQQSFLELRRRLRDKPELWKFEKPVDGIVRPLFEQSLSVFPGGEFPQLRSLTSHFKRVGRFALDQGVPALDAFDRISEDYWQAFCYFLRIHPRGHFHVSESRLRHWGRVADQFLASVGPRMNAYAEELVSAFATSIDPLDRAALVGSDWGGGSPLPPAGVDSLVYP